MKKIYLNFLLTMLLTTVITTNPASASTEERLNSSPELTFESLDSNGDILEGTMVTVINISEGENARVVFQEKTDKHGKVKFKSIISQDNLNRSPGDIADAVYEVYFVSPEGEISKELFSVPHVKSSSKISNKELVKLEKERVKEVKMKFRGDSPKKDKLDTNTSNEAQPISISALGCVDLGYTGSYCVNDERYYTADTKIGEVNLSYGETVAFNLTSSSRVAISSGIKGADGWTKDSSVTLTSDTATSTDYTIPGNCLVSGSTSQCNLTRSVYAKYYYRYQQKDFYYQGSLVRKEYTVTPIQLNGSSTKAVWSTTTNNGKPVSGVIANNYGAYFVISSGSSTTKSYSKEFAFTAAASIPTPVGTFGAGLNTSYKDAHSVKWSTSTSSKYYHYDLGTYNAKWYVTK